MERAPTSLSGTTGNSQRGSAATARMLQLPLSMSMVISLMHASVLDTVASSSNCTPPPISVSRREGASPLTYLAEGAQDLLISHQ